MSKRLQTYQIHGFFDGGGEMLRYIQATSEDEARAVARNIAAKIKPGKRLTSLHVNLI